MKRFIAFLVFLAFSFTYLPVQAGDGDHKDGVKMKDGKVWMMKDGKKTEVKQEVTLTDGTKVNPNGTVIMADGSSKMMQNGDMISMDGKWHNRKMIKDEKKEDKAMNKQENMK